MKKIYIIENIQWSKDNKYILIKISRSRKVKTGQKDQDFKGLMNALALNVNIDLDVMKLTIYIIAR